MRECESETEVKTDQFLRIYYSYFIYLKRENVEVRQK